MKKIITVLLVAIMLFSVVACAKDTNKGPSTDKGPEAPQGKQWDKREFDFDGFVFTILAKDPNGFVRGWDGDDIDVEEITGEEVLDEVYNRNRLIEQTYNCVIEMASSADVKNTIMSGTDEDGSMISETIKMTFSLVEDELLCDLNDPNFKYLSLDKSYYGQTIQRDTEIAGHLYFVDGDMLFSDENAMWVIFFNKELASRYVTDANLYDLVRTGKWTIDEFNKYAALATDELDGNDKMNQLDQWGYVGEAPNVAAFVSAAGYRYASITEDGSVVSEVFSQDFSNVFEKCYSTVDPSFCILASDMPNTFTDRATMFQEGRALFAIMGMTHIFNLREVDTDFGVLPIPKLNEAQEDYHVWTTYNTIVVSVPYTCTDFERTSAIMEALFEESSYGLRSAYVDKALKYQSTRDDDSIEMLDLMINSTVYDIGVTYDFGGIYTALNDKVKVRQLSSVSSLLAKSRKAVQTDIDDLLAKLKDNA